MSKVIASLIVLCVALSSAQKKPTTGALTTAAPTTAAPTTAAPTTSAPIVIITAENCTTFTEKEQVSGASADDFGRSVDVSGNTVLVGAPDRGGKGAGLLYKRNTTTGLLASWAEITSTLHNGSRLGHAVALNGYDCAFLGAPGRNISYASQGVVYSYYSAQNLWAEYGAVGTPTPANNGRFGEALVATLNFLFVGAAGEGTGGKVHVFMSTGDPYGTNCYYIYDRAIVPSVTASGDEFGYSISQTGEQKVLIGAPLADYDSTTTDSGAVHLYSFVGVGLNWVEVVRLVSPSPVSGGKFGYSVAIDGSLIAIGEPGAGAVHIYQVSGGSVLQVQTIYAGTPSTNGQFGSSVSISGTYLTVGAVGSADANLYQWNGSQFVCLSTFVASNPSSGDAFAQVVKTHAYGVIVGAPGADSVYTFCGNMTACI
jgi:hypothetical protein